MSHYEWQVIRKSAGVWTTIGTYLDHGAWEEVA